VGQMGAVGGGQENLSLHKNLSHTLIEHSRENASLSFHVFCSRGQYCSVCDGLSLSLFPFCLFPFFTQKFRVLRCLCSFFAAQLFSFLSFFFCALTHRLVTCLTHSHTQAPHVTPTRHPKESTHAHLTRFSLLLALSRICLAEGGNNKNNEAEKPHNRGGWARQNKSKQLFRPHRQPSCFPCVFSFPFPFSFSRQS